MYTVTAACLSQTAPDTLAQEAPGNEEHHKDAEDDPAEIERALTGIEGAEQRE